ncbi:MAG TPA: sigma-70 family RNA polymerase sigma factor [Pyrinomonadaceae bacterium]|nr:sigma-70 family RNA polymerase sigma factor [Pyrinomonadaceae bacterium]
MTTSETALIERAQKGDAEAFCELAKTYQRRIYLLALHYCRHAEDAEDLSQEVWLKAFRGLGRFKGESSFYTWLRTITINSFLNRRRELTVTNGDEKTTILMRELEAADEHAALNAAPLDAEDGMERQVLVGRVMRALGELNPSARLMFLLKHREGMTYEEIAREFNCSTGAVKKSLFRAVLKLRQHLGVDAGRAGYEATTLAAGEKS